MTGADGAVPPAGPSPAPTVADAPGEGRYEARLGAELVGIAEYRLAPGRIVFTHTEVDAGHRGGGLASALVRAALDDARRRGLEVEPRCPYVAGWIRRHGDYADLVA